MDWDRVRAEDLFLALSSFCPPGGRLLKVSIYPSEFGKKRIAEEEALGPEELRGSKNIVVVDERCCTVSRILFSKKFTSLPPGVNISQKTRNYSVREGNET